VITIEVYSQNFKHQLLVTNRIDEAYQVLRDSGEQYLPIVFDDGKQRWTGIVERDDIPELLTVDELLEDILHGPEGTP
jgi:hypothetical protein